MPEVNEAAVEAALNDAFSDAPVERVAKETARPLEADESPPEPEAVEAAPEDDAEADVALAPVVAEPEFEIVIDGVPEIVKGADQIKELLQKGRDYGRKAEAVARARDAIQAQYNQQMVSAKFQELVLEDVSQLRSLDAQLEQYQRIDWSTAYDTDPFNAMKLKEQRDQLREVRSAKLQEITGKHQQFQQSQAQAAQQMLAAESAALFAKLPEWRNSDNRTKEQQKIRASLENAGFNPGEIDGVIDHRMLLVARKAAMWDELQSGKKAKIGQVQAAPPVIKPGSLADKGKVQARDEMKTLRSAVKNNDTRTQEALVERMLNRAFK